MEIMFINYGYGSSSHRRIIVPKEKADAKYEEIKNNLKEGAFIGLNEAYVSLDNTVEQGKCVRYENI